MSGNDSTILEIAEAIAEYVPRGLVQARMRDEALRLISAAPALLCRSSSLHLTASGVVVADGGLLLHVHRRSGLMLPPGGHFERGESLAACVEREILEETGVRAECVKEVVHLYLGPAVHCARHLDLATRCIPVDTTVRVPVGESTEVAWVNAAGITQDPRIPDDLRMCLLAELHRA